jgi:adenosylcobinamide-phosphate synthase
VTLGLINYLLSASVAIAVLILAIMLDLILGDPSPNYPDRLVFKLHPTVLMGKFIKKIEPYFKNSKPKTEKFLGVLLGLTVIGAFILPVFFSLWAVYAILGIVVYTIFAILLLKSTICIKLETDWAKKAAKAIQNNDLAEAKKYSHFSRRESKDLDGEQISSAVIESMAENLIDFKLSPMLSYAFFGVTGAIAFRAVNTLDGMVGFKDKEHFNTGWFSANLDTVINYIPTRITALLMVISAAILKMDYRNSFKIAIRDHRKTPSRNHGWPMAAMSGALRVQLEKPGQYILGDNLEPMTGRKILAAIQIRDVTIILWLFLCILIVTVTRLFFFPL